MPSSKKTSRKTKNSHSLIEYAKKLKELNKFDIEFEGNVASIIENPRQWAELFAEKVVVENIPRYMNAKELGKEFADEIRNRN
tara:strand:- start:607 stop:855 length:249 start_codon:yes stop_codon:yes gene_type:complete